MSNYIKTGGTYKIINKIYRKENGVWVEKTITDMSAFLTGLSSLIMYNPKDIASMVYMILGPDSVSAESFNLDFLFNSTVPSDVAWSITAGQNYASIDSSGNVTIDSLADNSSINVHAVYVHNGTPYSADKEITVTYLSGATASQESTVEIDGNNTITVTTVETIEFSDNTTQTNTMQTVTASDGSYTDTSTSVLTDVSGNTQIVSSTASYDSYNNLIRTSETIGETHTDGSSSSETTNYDSSGDPVSAVINNRDSDGNSHTEDQVFDENGNPVTTAYVIDTSDNPDGYEDVTGTGVNTHFVPFDGASGFVMHVVFKTLRADQPNPPIVPDTEDQSLLYNIIGAKSAFTPWPGFYIRWQSTNLMLNCRFSDNSYNNTVTSQHVDNIYDFTVTYDPNATSKTFGCINNNTGREILNGGKGYTGKYFQDLENLMVTIGYAINQQGNPYRYANVDIYEFSINKL